MDHVQVYFFKWGMEKGTSSRQNIDKECNGKGVLVSGEMLQEIAERNKICSAYFAEQKIREDQNMLLKLQIFPSLS